MARPADTRNKGQSILDKFVEIASRVGAQRHLGAIRDGFASIMPIIICGSIAHILILQIPLTLNPTPGIDVMTWRDLLSQHVPWFVDLCLQVWWATFGILSLFAVFSIAYQLTKAKGGNPLGGGITALAAYFTFVPQAATVTVEGVTGGAWGLIDWNYTSANGLFVAIIVALLSAELFTVLCNAKFLEIKMPEGVPPAVSRSFAVLFPGIITIFAASAHNTAILKVSGAVMLQSTGEWMELNFFQLMTRLIQPLLTAVDSLGAALGIVALNQILWFFGLHGSNILEGFIQPISLQLVSENLTAYEAGAAALPHIVTKPFLDAFVHLGGSGATLGLVIAILLVSRSKATRTMGKLSIAPGIFNINEPAIFGMPIVLNLVYLIPFFLVPLILVCTSYFATSLGLVSRTVAQIPWATPPILSGWLVTGGDWRAIILQIVNIVISVVAYMPFVKIADQAELKKEQELAGTLAQA